MTYETSNIMNDLEKALCKGLKSCPFCGSQPEFAQSNPPSDRSCPARWLQCSSERDQCPIKPQTKSYRIQEWEQGIGHYFVDKTELLVKQWQQRSIKKI